MTGESTEVVEPKPMRRGRRGKKPKCLREGCDRGVRNGHNACCFLCDVVAQELDRAQRLCETIEDTEHWLAVVSLNDALTEYYRSDKRIYLAAREAGFTDEQWNAIKRGRQPTKEPPTEAGGSVVL